MRPPLSKTDPVSPPGQLGGRRIAFLCTNGVEQSELTSPWQAVLDAGGLPVLLSLESGSITGMHDDWEHGDTFAVDQVVSEVDATDFDGLVLPGGTLNADQVRVNEGARRFVRAFFEAGLPVAAICHAPWILIDAGVVRGRCLTSYPSVATDLRNAGATWVDAMVLVDAGLVTSRSPQDLEAFNAKLIEEISEGKHEGQHG